MANLLPVSNILVYSCQFVADQIFLFIGFLPSSAFNSQEKLLKKRYKAEYLSLQASKNSAISHWLKKRGWKGPPQGGPPFVTLQSSFDIP
jgi:hypothetical protein